MRLFPMSKRKLYGWPYDSLIAFGSLIIVAKQLIGRRNDSASALGSAIFQCIQGVLENDYLSALKGRILKFQKCISVKRD